MRLKSFISTGMSIGMSITPLLLTISASAGIVDRVEIAVGNRAITQSDIDLRIRLTAFQNRQSADFRLAARREAARRLVDQLLIEREMEVGHYPRIGAPVIGDLLASFEKLNYPTGHAAMLAALAGYRLTEADIRTDLARQADLLTFLNLRFRPSIDVADEEVKKYFDEKVPDAAKQQLGIGGMRAQIEEAITAERADKDMEVWLRDQRKRTKIDYPDPELAEAGK
jgi:hypothetical protein